jgi:hypothetical protein
MPIGDLNEPRRALVLESEPPRASEASEPPAVTHTIYTRQTAAVTYACPVVRQRPGLAVLQLAARIRMTAAVRRIDFPGRPGQSGHRHGVTVLRSPADQARRGLARRHATVQRVVRCAYGCDRKGCRSETESCCDRENCEDYVPAHTQVVVDRSLCVIGKALRQLAPCSGMSPEREGPVTMQA